MGKEAALRRLQEEPLSSPLTSSSYWTKVMTTCSCLLHRGLEGECAVDPVNICKRTPLTTVESLIEAELAALASVETKSRSGDSRSTASPESIKTEETGACASRTVHVHILVD